MLLLSIGLLSLTSFAQHLPDKIRGYKVHNQQITTGTAAEDPESEAAVAITFGRPELSEVDIDGFGFSVYGTIEVSGQSGKVDFLTFRDFRVNGLPVEIREYKKSFRFKNGKAVELEEPVEIFVGLPSAIRGAAKEMKGGAEDWEVTGTVFVFGRFNKWIFSFKRVVPVYVRFRVPNPLK